MKLRVWSASALVCEMIGVAMLFFWAWPQPDFFTENLLSLGEAKNAKEIVSHKRWHSVRAGAGLSLLAIGYGIQITIVLCAGRSALVSLVVGPDLKTETTDSLDQRVSDSTVE